MENKIKIYLSLFVAVLLVLVSFFFVYDTCYAEELPENTPAPTYDPYYFPIPPIDFDEQVDYPYGGIPWDDYILYSGVEVPNSLISASGGLRNPPNSTVLHARAYKYIYDPIYTPPVRYVDRYGNLRTDKPAYYNWDYNGAYYQFFQLTGATPANTQFQLNPYRQSYYVDCYIDYLREQNFNDGKDVRFWVQLPDISVQYADSSLRPAVYASLTLTLVFTDNTTNTFYGLVSLQELGAGCYIDGDAEGREVKRANFLCSIWCDGVNNLLVSDSSNTRTPIDPPDLGGDVYLQTSAGIRVAEYLIDSKLPTTVNNLLSLVRRIFVPSSTDITTLINNVYNDTSTNDPSGGLSLGKTIMIRLLQLFSTDYTVEPPVLHIPAWSFNVGGETVQPFNGYDFDFSTLPSNLLVYTRMVGDFVLVSGFVSFVWVLFTRFYSTHIAGSKNND